MPRSGSGSCSLAEPAFIANTPIVSADVNSDLDDIIDMLTDSLSRSGDGGMQAALQLDNDGFTYLTDPNTGMSRSAADTQVITAGGVDVATFTSTDVDVLSLKVNGTTAFPVPTAQIADGSVTTIKLANGAVTAAKVSGNFLPFSSGMSNGTIVESHAGNAVTFTIKTLAGATPSASDSVKFYFRNVTAGTGDYTVVELTAALSLTISSGSTVGFSNVTAGRLWLLAINNAGTVELAAINCRLTASIYRLNGWGIITTTAEGGSGGADSAQVPYSATARSAVPYIPIGYAAWETGLTTAGTWNASPDRLQLVGPGVPLPGMEIQVLRTDDGAFASGTTVLPADDTIPQNTEGDQYLSQGISPTSGCNLLFVKARVIVSSGATINTAALFRDSTAGALAADMAGNGTSPTALDIDTIQFAAATSATTFKVRAGPQGAATMNFNGTLGARLMGGVFNSFIEVREVMA